MAQSDDRWPRTPPQTADKLDLTAVIPAKRSAEPGPESRGLEDEGKTMLVAGSVFAAGLVAWVSMMGLAFVTWGAALT